MGLKKEHIVFFLKQFADIDYSDIACQKRLIKTFINSVFVYDDKVVLTFNYSGDRRTMTLKEIDGGLQQGIRIPRAVVHQEKPYHGCGVAFLNGNKRISGGSLPLCANEMTANYQSLHPK